MRRILILLLLGFWGRLDAQSCNCQDAFRFLQTHFEKDYAGFHDKVTTETQSRYDSLSKAVFKRADGVLRPVFCMGLLKEWLMFFKDGHNYITGAAGSLDSDSTEVITLKPAVVAALRKRRKGVEGIYHISDSTYTVAIIRSRTANRDYAGVIVESRTPAWKVGQVKLELKAVGRGKFVVCAYLRDHSMDAENFVFDGVSFAKNDWYRDGVGLGAGAASGVAGGGAVSGGQYPVVQSRRLSDKTYYIGIGSFDDPNYKTIDSLFHADSAILTQTPYLVLDVRGNGGGSDFCYAPVSPWLYTGPIHTVGVDVLSTADNVAGWSELLKSRDLPMMTRAYLFKIITQMKKDTGHMVQIVGDDVTTLPEERLSPEKVVVLINGGCASTTEQFLLEARQSRKVTVMGQHTAGILDYANVRELRFPCLPFVLHYATTRSRRVDMGMGIDNVGIQPKVVLEVGGDWVEEARRYLEGIN